MVYYKVLNKERQSCHKGNYQWIPGEWAPPQAVTPCYTGYHLCNGTEQLLAWLGETIWIAEARGEIVAHEGTKVVCESARIVEQLPWDERVARLFAADCAEHVLHLYEERHDNPAPRRAIEVARAYARGEATMEDLDAAALSAAEAAWSVACSTAYAAARSAAEAAADAAAWNVACSTAWAATDSVRYAACSAERQWQAERLAWYIDGCPLPAKPVIGDQSAGIA